MSKFGYSLTLAFLVLLTSSCGFNKKLVEQSIYFKNLNDTTLTGIMQPVVHKYVKGDILVVTVSTRNETARQLLNPILNNNPDQKEVGGYVVDENGEITFPVVGKIKVADQTKEEVIALLTARIKETLVEDPIVSIKLQNFKFTILGEVFRPSVYSVPSERITLLEAIGLAGDLTPFGRRDRVRVIRTIGDTQQAVTLNLNQSDIFNSPFFYLQQNDIVYVEMNERKFNNVDQTGTRNLAIFTSIISALSVIAIAISRF